MDQRDRILNTLKNKRYSIISNDLDGVLSAMIVKMVFNINTIGYFSPDIFAMDNYYLNRLDDVIGLDMTLDSNNRIVFDTISNHVERFDGIGPTSSSISCNDHITVKNYQEKTLYSTTLMLWDALGLSLPDSDIGKMFLLSIDSTFLQFYNNKFRHIIIRDLKNSGFEDLIDVLERYSEKDFYNLQDRFKLKSELKIKGDGERQILLIDDFIDRIDLRYVLKELGVPGLSLGLLNGFNTEYRSWCVLSKHYCTPEEYLEERENGRIFSYAIPYKRSVSYSLVEYAIDERVV